MTYYCERTGRTWANEAQALDMEGNCDPNPINVIKEILYIPPSSTSPGGWDTRERADDSLKLLTNQIQSSQYWMDKGYEESGLPLPSLAENAYYSDAVRAWNNALKIKDAETAEHGNVNPNMLGDYAPLSQGTTEQQYVAQTIIPDEISNFIGGASQAANQVMGWINQNLLLVACVIVGVFFLPSILGAGASALSSGRRRYGR